MIKILIERSVTTVVVIKWCFIRRVFLKNKFFIALISKENIRITPYINYAYIHCLKKTKDRTILSSAIVLEIFNFFSKSFLKRTNFAAFCTKIRFWTFWNKFRTIFAFRNLTLIIRISLPFYDFLQVIIVLNQVYNWEIRHHSKVCRCRLADILYFGNITEPWVAYGCLEHPCILPLNSPFICSSQISHDCSTW